MTCRKTSHVKRLILIASLAGFGMVFTPALLAQPMPNHQAQNHQEHQGHQGHDMDTMKSPAMEVPAANARTLPPVPTNLPRWMENKDRNHIYRKRGRYNDDINNVRSLALDLNAVAVGHAMAYEDLVTGKANRLETDTFNRINWVLNNPPRFMPDEANISPTFGRKYGVLEQVFDWTHILHAQTVDVLASTQLTEAEKEAEIDRLYRFYLESVRGRTGTEDTGFDPGDVSVGVFHNFNREYDNTPAFAVRADAEFPTGRDSQGVDFRLRGIASKTVGQYDRLHLNLDLNVKSQPEDDERRFVPGVVLGYSRPLGYPRRFDRTGLAELAVRASSEEGAGAVVSAGIGLRQQVGYQSVLDIG